MSVTFIVDPNSKFRIKLPRRDVDVLTLAETYIHREKLLPESERTPVPPLAEIETLWQAACQATVDAHQGEEVRTLASTEYGRQMRTLIDHMRWTIGSLVRENWHEPPRVGQWGVQLVKGKRRWRVVYPQRHEDWLQLLNRYIACEESRPPGERRSRPPLAELVALRAEVLASKRESWVGETARMANVSARRKETAVLRDKLLVALHVLIGCRFNGRITLNLQDWGFEVVYKRPRQRKTAVAGAAE